VIWLALGLHLSVGRAALGPAPCPGFAYQQLAVCVFACNPSPAYLPPPQCATPPGGGPTPCDCWDPCWQRFLRECPGKG